MVTVAEPTPVPTLITGHQDRFRTRFAAVLKTVEDKPFFMKTGLREEFQHLYNHASVKGRDVVVVCPASVAGKAYRLLKEVTVDPGTNRVVAYNTPLNCLFRSNIMEEVQTMLDRMPELEGMEQLLEAVCMSKNHEEGVKSLLLRQVLDSIMKVFFPDMEFPLPW